MEPASLAILSSAALAASAYLNAKLSIGVDIEQISWERQFQKLMGEKIRSLGNTLTLYGMLAQVKDMSVDALWFEGRTWSYSELKDNVDRLAAFLSLDTGLKANDYAAVYTTNSPEMVFLVLALSKLGVVAGLINTNLRDDTLNHALDISTASIVISTPDLTSFVNSSRKHYSINLGFFPSTSFPSEIIPITPQSLATANPSLVTAAPRALKDISILVYTSGTTGKPKACGVINMQLMVVSTIHPLDHNNRSTYFPLRNYSALPLFHGTGHFSGFCHAVGTGSTFCLARKFSATNFFKDVAESGATRILYIGELCRYLLQKPPGPYDKSHKCKVAYGNGLRNDIWEKFRERFNIEEIREIYRSTEGLAKFDNFRMGAWGQGKIGFHGRIRRLVEDQTFIVRAEDGEIWRDPKTGFAKVVSTGEAGEVIGRIRSRELVTAYLNNEEATEGKFARDVFVKGDLFQRMGDLAVRDSDGWVYFADRTGDTFRWKGENVSAGEVREHMMKLSGVVDAVIYGVRLPSYDGKAGAAAIALDSDRDEDFVKGLYASLKQTGLPSYALPRLVRITKEINTGATFKQAKMEYEGRTWTAHDNEDKLYWLNGTVYQRLDEKSWDAIEKGRAKL